MKNLYHLYSKLSVHAREVVQDLYVDTSPPRVPSAEKKTQDKKPDDKKSEKKLFLSPLSEPVTKRKTTRLPVKKKIFPAGLRQGRHKGLESKDLMFEFRKMMLMCEMLLRREMHDEGEELLKKLLALSHEMELFNEQLQLYSLAGAFKIALPGKDGQKKYREEMAGSITKYNEATVAAGVFSSGDYQDLSPIDLKKHLETLFLLKQHYEDTGFARIGFLYHYSSLCYNSAMGHYRAAIFHGEQLLDLVQKSHRVFPEYNIENVIQKLGGCYLCTGDLGKALEKSRTAVLQAANHSAPQAQGLEVMFCTLLRKKEYLALDEIIGKAQRNRFVKCDRFQTGKWKMMQAAFLFQQEQFRESLKLLKGCCGLPREKAEWILYTQLLEAMCRAELGQHEWFYYRAEALRKSIYRYENKYRHQKNGRISLIYRLLKELHRNDMDYQLLLEEEADALELLRCSEGNFFWAPSGPELVRFDEWIEIKARRQTKRRGNKLVA